MNSYDLAAWIDQYSLWNDADKPIFDVISKRLRDQADKIADLETAINFLEHKNDELRNKR